MTTCWVGFPTETKPGLVEFFSKVGKDGNGGERFPQCGCKGLQVFSFCGNQYVLEWNWFLKLLCSTTTFGLHSEAYLSNELHYFGRDSEHDVLRVYRFLFSLRPTSEARIRCNFSFLECAVDHVVHIIWIQFPKTAFSGFVFLPWNFDEAFVQRKIVSNRILKKTIAESLNPQVLKTSIRLTRCHSMLSGSLLWYLSPIRTDEGKSREEISMME